MGSAEKLHLQSGQEVPSWVSTPVQTYLAHTEGGATLRALARAAGCHPSTTLRQVQRIEALRDDPLADAALARIGSLWRVSTDAHAPLSSEQDCSVMIPKKVDDAQITYDSLMALKALNEPDCLMVIADGVEEAVIVHNAGGDRPVRRAVVHRDTAEMLALREFIKGRQTGRLTRYTITQAGRAELNSLLAELETARVAEYSADPDENVPNIRESFALKRIKARNGKPNPKRSAGSDAPLYVLARRRRSDGEPWLTPDLIAAAFRFHETYEIARMGGDLTRDWNSLMLGQVSGGDTALPSGRATRRLEAEQALSAAIRALGPDLTEMVILSVCHEQGMEDVERRLGYPSRSGKLVLRIALHMLARHYQEIGSGDYDMIY